MLILNEFNMSKIGVLGFWGFGAGPPRQRAPRGHRGHQPLVAAGVPDSPGRGSRGRLRRAARARGGGAGRRRPRA